MMFIAAKPATARQRSRKRISRLVALGLARRLERMGPVAELARARRSPRRRRSRPSRQSTASRRLVKLSRAPADARAGASSPRSMSPMQAAQVDALDGEVDVRRCRPSRVLARRCGEIERRRPSASASVSAGSTRLRETEHALAAARQLDHQRPTGRRDGVDRRPRSGPAPRVGELGRVTSTRLVGRMLEADGAVEAGERPARARRARRSSTDALAVGVAAHVPRRPASRSASCARGRGDLAR